MLKKRRKYDSKEIDINALKNIFILNEIKDSNENLNKFLSYCSTEVFSAGSYVYREGDKSNNMYIMLEGIVSVLKKSVVGQDFLLVTLGASEGCFFGEIALMDKQERTATIRAKTDIKLLALSRKRFLQMVKEDPSLALTLSFTIGRILAQRLQQTNYQLSQLYETLAHEIESY